ncbi:outer membrane protein A [Serratia symbiotica str. 'Cinara cedri']|nr:outer membrane protein A [Serratia symbiotica str. 'Cinara cedri']
MKKIAIALVITGFATLAQAAPKNNTWYIGSKLGWSEDHDISLFSTGYLNEINNNSTHKNKLGAGAFFGYQANKYLGFEIEYDWLGRTMYKGSLYNGAIKLQGVQLAAKLSYPIIDNLDIYTRFGGMVWHQHSKYNYENAPYLSSGDTGVIPLTAIGVEYALTKNLATRLDYQFIRNINNNTGIISTDLDNTMLSIGISYHFSQKNTINPIVQTPENITIAKPFTLKSNVLFDFNQSTLKEETKHTLDQLYMQLSSMNPKEHSVIIRGYTDAIGSEEYNCKLSEKRIQGVLDFLISKGMSSDKISVLNIGRTASLNTNSCGYKSGHATKSQIHCLAPDRHVEIEVKGIK